MRTRVVLSACLIFAAGVVAAVLPASGARAGTPVPVPLGITGFYQMAVDPVHDHIFISQGDVQYGGSILVYDFSGNLVTQILGITDPMGITLSPDYSTLYVAEQGPPSYISLISTATLQQTSLLVMPGSETPVNLALQSGKLWVSYTTVNTSTANIGDFDLSTASNFEAQPAMGDWPVTAPNLAADPGDHGVLVAAGPIGGTPVATFDTQTDPVTVLAPQKYSSSCGGVGQVATLDDGTRFALTCQGSSPKAYDTASLAATGSFPVGYGNSAVALAVSPDGYLAAGSPESGVFVFDPAGHPVSATALDSSLIVPTAGLGWSPDDSELFVVARSETTGDWVLQVIPDPTTPTPVVPVKTSLSILTATDAASYAYGKKVEVFAVLGSTFADRAVSVYVTPAGQPRQLLLAGNVVDGQVHVIYRLTRTSTFTAVFTGDAHNLPASATVTTPVTASVAAKVSGAYKTTTISGVKYYVFHHSALMKLLATVTPDKKGECVRPEREESSSSRTWASDKVSSCVKLSATSHAQVPLSLKGLAGHRFRIRADYVRDSRDTANLSADSGWVYFAVTP